jgi:hypothetical protein
MRRISLRAMLLTIIAAPSFAWASTSCVDAEAAGRLAIEAQHRLQNAPADKSDADGASVSPQQRTEMRAFKDALVNAIDARLSCSDARAQPDALQRALEASFGVVKTPPVADTNATNNGTDKATIGGAMNVSVTRSTANKPLMLVRAGFGIPCGDDNLLVAYAWDGAAWRRVLRWQSDNYDSISGAFGDTFQYSVLPGGQIAVAHGGPLCSSRWHVFGLDVFAPANDKQAQRSLFHLDHAYAEDLDGANGGLTLKARPDGFELRTSISPLDGELITRKAVYRYRVKGDTVERIQPAAINGRDFVDAWLTVDDASARNWSDPHAADALLAARQSLMASIKDHSKSLSYGPVRACASGKDRYQVEIDSQARKPGDANTQYGVVRQERNGFTMISLGETADPSCKGADLMAR